MTVKMPKSCKYEDCESNNLVFEKTQNTVHYGKIKCADCGRLQKWVSDPNSNDQHNKRNTEIEDILKQREFEDAFCFWCTRKREELGYNETLEVDHIRELSDGGEDKASNCRIVCTKCHKQRNHDKLYVKEHLQKFYEGEKS